MSFLSVKVLSLDVSQRLIFDLSHLTPIANGILQSPHNNSGRGISPHVYRRAELIQDPVDGQNQTDAGPMSIDSGPGVVNPSTAQRNKTASGSMLDSSDPATDAGGGNQSGILSQFDGRSMTL